MSPTRALERAAVAAHRAGETRTTEHPNMDCVNLRERFGRQYRIEYEESYYAERGAGARADDPWLQIIPCRAGHIYPWGTSTLAASTNSRGSTARKLAALDFTTVHQDGSDGMTILFPVEKFPKVAALMHPWRRRQMTEEQRQAAAERLAKYAFTPAVQRPETAQISTQGAKAV
ncbi:MAG: hypothetical protein ABSG86_29730 [Thermoguttaceae bacterium]